MFRPTKTPGLRGWAEVGRTKTDRRRRRDKEEDFGNDIGEEVWEDIGGGEVGCVGGVSR